MRRIVCDTGPVLHLREAGALPLLRPAGQVLVPPAVDAELRRLDAAWHGQRPDWMAVSELAGEHGRDALAWQQADLLGPGESEAIALARQIGADWLLTDDAAARLVARSVGLEVHGSLGVILWAAAACHIDRAEAQATLDGLIHSSLWMSARVVEESRAALQQIFD